MSIEEIRSGIISCKKCDLHKTRINSVPGEGPINAKAFLIGEAPGAREDETGKPFNGRAGEILNELIESAGMKRENFFISSILKCRPPKNRNPKSEEIEACTPYLVRQIELINPKLIVLLGRHSAKFFLGKDNISEMHGKTFKWKNFETFVTYHPAAAIYNRSLLPEMKNDFKKIAKLLH